jgi:hypothetical protein
MPRSTKYEWQHPYNAARTESNPDKLLPLLGCAIEALERRSAEWGNELGTKAEVRAVLESISTLRQRLTWYLDTKAEQHKRSA